MQYKVEFTKKSSKILSNMDSQVSKRIKKWIKTNLEGCENPRQQGKPLTGNLKGYWRYEVSDYRIIADIQDDKIIILVTDIGHRREIYKQQH